VSGGPPPLGFEPVIPVERCLDARMGVALQHAGAEGALASLRVHEGLLGRNGLLHGGVLAAMAEGLASSATAIGVVDRGLVPAGMSNETRTLADVTGGTITATARRRAARDDLWLWEIEARDEDGRTCALSTVAIALRPWREPRG